MAKKRLIFTLHYSSEYFCLSRNFRLQKAGDLNWLNKNYNFPKIAFSIDELVVLDVSRENRNRVAFHEVLRELAKEIFVPIAAGGGIRTFQDAKNLFENGADKIVVNSILHENPELIYSIAEVYGAQSILASIDFTLNDRGENEVHVENGSKKIDISLPDYIQKINKLPIGEIYLHSMRQDGTGQGYDMNAYISLKEYFQKPLIISGGAGNRFHLEEGLSLGFADAVSTANLFNFIGNGLPGAREYLLEKNINLPVFES
ncbi:MAG: imidazole glycerol phosphate synthase subunit HisF [Leptospiraceae bacterium]|nr:imidazole glycerol phosphate synthase subunit HisF [Leptospiraceae bacterium]